MLERGASQWYMTNSMSFDATFVFANDDLTDAFSNGLVIQGCNSITPTAENIFVKGWQAVFIDKCGFDLGSGGTAALYFLGCQDVYISKSFVSSNNSTTRQGIRFENGHTGKVDACTIVNNSMGVFIQGIASGSTKIVVDSCKFDGNATNDVFLFNNSKACKIVNNHFSKQMARTGTAFEVYGATTGADFNLLIANTFAGVSYNATIGAGSFATGNLFSVGV